MRHNSKDLRPHAQGASLNSKSGTLFVVATPIGNIEDMTARARTVLAEVSVIAAEDTRHTARLLERLGIKARLLSYHEHNEAERTERILEHLGNGEDVALVSDAGTPLLSDPGFRVVRAAAEAGLNVSPVPGCSAAVAALSIAGLPTDAILFRGFLPSGHARRRKVLGELATRTETLVLYESVHRIGDTLAALGESFGESRPMVAARELTKVHETVYRGNIAEVSRQIEDDSGSSKGEYTLVIGGNLSASTDAKELDRVLGVLLGYLGVRQAADAAAKLLGVKKNGAYKRALELRESTDDQY
jgi:16S rRNA (cytidine1402-2'-O)-methyltransferase